MEQYAIALTDNMAYNYEQAFHLFAHIRIALRPFIFAFSIYFISLFSNLPRVF